MEMIRRIAAFILAIFTALVSLCLLAVASRLVPWTMFINAAEKAYGSNEAVLGAAALLGYSLIVVALCLSGKRKKEAPAEIFLSDAKGGQVRISAAVISDIVTSAAMSVKGVREAKAEAKQAGSGQFASLTAALDIAISPDANMRQIGEEVRAVAQNALLRTADIADAAIEVRIADVAQSAAKADKRVV